MTTASPVPKDTGRTPPRWGIVLVTRLHVLLHRLTGSLNTFNSKEVCFVTMTGARSGRTLMIPLMYVPYGEGVLLVASQGGASKNPLWYHNLVKHPNIEVEHRGTRQKYCARLADAAEKTLLWPTCDHYWPDYAKYRMRTARNIPIFVCEPH